MTTTPAPTLEAAAEAAVGTLQRAEFTLRAAPTDDPEAGDARTITGLGVPYGAVIEHMFGRETFDPGSIEGAESAVILWQHLREEPVGRVTAVEDAEDGMTITARLSSTARADEALTLTRDGVVTGLSIGFEPLEYRIEHDDESGEDTLHWTRVTAREFSLVTFPAYDTARTRSTLTAPERTPAMPQDTITREDLDALDTRMTDLDRTVALLGNGTGDAAADLAAEAQRFSCMGDFVRALAMGDEHAADLYSRAFAVRAEGTTADVAEVADVSGTAGWLGNFIRLIEDRRRTVNLFTRAPLPAKGMTVDYAQYRANTLQVGKQAAEGADLPGPGKLTFTTESEPVETYGGWTDLTRQLIERADVPYLDTVWKALGLRYSAVTDAAFRDRLLAEVAGIIAGGEEGTTITLPGTDVYDYFDAIIDAGDHYAGTGFDLTGLLVDKDEFKKLSRIEGTDGRPLMSVYGQGVNVVGEVNLPKGDGNIGRVPVNVLWGAPAGTRFFYDPVAAELRESSGAPVRLQDDNIVNLTRAFSLYGYAAVTVPFPGALVPLVDATEGA